MTVPAGVAREQYAGSGSTGPFAFNHKTYAATHLKVVRTTDDVDATLVITTDYTVSLASTFDSADITLIDALAVGETLTVVLDPPIEQLIAYADNDPFPASTHERALDLAVMLIGRLDEKINRSILLPESSAVSGLTLPDPDPLLFLRWNAAGDALENMGVADAGALAVSPFAETLLDDTTAGDMLTTLGVSAYIQTLLNDANAGAALTTLGISAFIQTLLDDADASAALSTLGVSTFAKTILDDANIAAVQATLGTGLVGPVAKGSGTGASAIIPFGTLTQYRAFKLLMTVDVATNGAFLKMRTDADPAGASPDTGATDYSWANFLIFASATTNTYDDDTAGDDADNEADITGPIGNASTEGCHLEITFQNPNNAAKWAKIKYESLLIDDGATPQAAHDWGFIVRKTAAVLGAIQIYASTGNITYDWALYGYTNHAAV